MRFRFKSKKLRALYEDEKGSEKYPAEVVDAFFDVMSVIRAAKDERDLRRQKAFHFERLSGTRKGQQSFRLNRQWRLIVSKEEDRESKYLFVIEIDNHYNI